MSKLLNGMYAFGAAQLDGNDLATQIYVDAAISGVSGDNLVVANDASLADYITNSGYDGSQMSMPDILFLANAPKGARRFWNNGDANGDETDFINVDEVLTNAEVQAALSAGQGLTYSGGEFSIADGAILPNMLDANVATAMSDAIGFSGDIVGDGSTTAFAVTHNAGTKDVVFSLRDKATDEFVNAQVVATDDNTLTVTFATAPAVSQDYRLTIKRVTA